MRPISMQGAVLGFTLAAALTGAARAADYVVVASTDPALRPGLSLDGGQRVALGSGKTLTLIAAAGDVTTLRGGAAGATVPRRTAQADDSRLQALRILVAPAPTGVTFGGQRGGVCPDPSGLRTLDDILAVQAGGCRAQARQALDAFVAHAAHAP